jgi:hypothetical protein
VTIAFDYARAAPHDGSIDVVLGVDRVPAIRTSVLG